MFLWERRMLKLIMFEKKKSIWLYQSQRIYQIFADWQPLSACHSFSPLHHHLLLCCVSSKIQSEWFYLGAALGARGVGHPRGGPSRGTWLKGDLKTVTKSANKPVCFLLSGWQAVLNNVNNKLLCPRQKKYFCWSRFQTITATDIEF